MMHYTKKEEEIILRKYTLDESTGECISSHVVRDSTFNGPALLVIYTRTVNVLESIDNVDEKLDLIVRLNKAFNINRAEWLKNIYRVLSIKDKEKAVYKFIIDGQLNVDLEGLSAEDITTGIQYLISNLPYLR